RSRSCRAAASGYRFAPSREATAASRTAAIGGEWGSFEETLKRRTPSSAGGPPGALAGGASRAGGRRVVLGGARGAVWGGGGGGGGGRCGVGIPAGMCGARVRGGPGARTTR